jgi:hypothetical protein
VYASSLMRYIYENDKKRKTAADALTAELFDMGFIQ